MTNQDAFNTVWNHFVVGRGLPSYELSEATTSGFRCLYRGPHNARCAFGILIPDELYTPFWEDKRAATILRMMESEGDLEFQELFNTSSILGDLQSCHDTAVEGLVKRLEDFHIAIETKLRQQAVNHSVTIPGE